jgi:hypothetical protein
MWPAFRLAVAFLMLASISVGVSVPLGPIYAMQAFAAACLVALSLFAMIAADVQSVLRLAIASAFAAIAAFGLMMPWGACELLGTAYVGPAVCPPDCTQKAAAQKTRLGWAAGLALGACALALVPQRIFDGGASSILNLLLADVQLLTLAIGL